VPSLSQDLALLEVLVVNKGFARARIKSLDLSLKSLFGRPPQHTVRTPGISDTAAYSADMYAHISRFPRSRERALR